MLYVSGEDVSALRPSWEEGIEVIRKCVLILANNDFSQPIKPYLRFDNPANRIIAMPAYIGGDFAVGGIKWIASFPENINRSIPRAHALTILNCAQTGVPLAIFDSSFMSGLRTAAVSGLMLKEFINAFPNRSFHLGICGFGFIGQLHLEMAEAVLQDRISGVSIFDASQDRAKTQYDSNASMKTTWQEVYRESDIFITCTTTHKPYIDIKPKPGSLQLNVSLRDYTPEIVMASSHIIVDTWEEVCREGTDIETAHRLYDLQKSDTYSLPSLIVSKHFENIDKAKFLSHEFALLSPMGMAVFDIALAKYFYDKALKNHIGMALDATCPV